MPTGNDDLERLSLGMVPLPVHPPMVPWRDIKSYGPLIIDHGTVGPQIYPPFVRVSTDDDISCAEIRTPIFLVPKRGRKLEKIGFSLINNVLEYRSTGNFLRGNRLECPHMLAPAQDKVPLA